MIRVIHAVRTITSSGKHAMPPPTLRHAIAAGLAALALVAATCITEGYAAASQIEPSASLHQILSDDERTILLGGKHSDVLYGIIDNPLTRWRQVTKTRKYQRHAPSSDEDLLLKMSSMGERFHLTLKKNHRLSSIKDPSKMTKSMNISRDCFYHGSSLNHPNSTAAISLCDGLRGYIDTGKAVYTILPLPDHITEKLKMNPKQKPHLVVKREAPTDTFCPHALRKQNLQRRDQSPREPRTPTRADWTTEKWSKREEKDPSRSRRSVSASAIIETAVFIDQALYDQMRTTFPTDTDRQLTTFVLTMMNAVQRLFQHSSLGKSPDVRLVLMETLKTQPQELKPSDNIDTYLTNFCIWQHNKRHYGRGKNPRWDHALLLSGINMYVVDESGRRKRHVVGLAPVSGMCNPLNSCTISEGTSFQTVLVAAHEMGHSLGMEHDGIQDGNNCDSDSFVMSPTLGTGKTTWSSCSRQYLEKFLRSQQSSCLQTTSAYATDLLDPPPENPPGQVYDADYQCALRYGEGSRRSALQNTEEICRMLRCETGYGSKGVSFAAHPALEGTNCGRDRWCHGGACLPIQRPSGTTRGRVIDGSWSAWSPYSPCSSDCVSRGSSAAVGIMVSTRRCDSPRPINGGRFCVGKERRVLTCDATRICAISTRKLMLEEFISDTCRQASARDATLENTGTQFPSQENSHSCYVWCHKRGGGYMTQGWTIPDGTPCWRGYSHQNMYCVKGECQRFDCNGYSTDESNDLRCSSSTSGSSALSPGPQPPVAEVGWSPWHKISQCRPSCIVGGRGFQLVTRECNSVSGCPGQRESYQLCDTSISQSCPLAKTVEQYAVEICQRYRVKYPTVLSGKGRQLPPQPGNPHSACIVACQDRVWQDTHYQMDVYEDGKFPFGTECSLDSRTKAYCINGRCQKFSEEGLPVSTETAHMYEVRRFLSHIQRRDTSGANHVVNTIKNSHVVSFKKWMAKLGPPDAPKGVATKKNTPLPEWIAKLEYGWVVEMSECSVACGGGMKNISVICQTGSTIVDDGFCSGMNKPDQTGLWPCNTHPCPGRWQRGPWSSCPVTCGQGNRTRDVICLQQLSQNVFSIVHESLCPDPSPVKSEICLEVICDENNNYVK